MKTILYSFALVACTVAPLTGCSDNNVAAEEKDWNTTTYFQSTDESGQKTYYKPEVGYVGDPMPFFDPKAKDFKILYLQDFRPNPAGTFHPIWGGVNKGHS